MSELEEELLNKLNELINATGSVNLTQAMRKGAEISRLEKINAIYKEALENWQELIAESTVNGKVKMSWPLKEALTKAKEIAGD